MTSDRICSASARRRRIRVDHRLHAYAFELAAGEARERLRGRRQAVLQVVLQPAVERRIEAALLPGKRAQSFQLGRQRGEKAFRRRREARCLRQRQHRLDEPVIEQRRAQLESMRHRAQVRLAQHVFGQVVGEVPAQQPILRRRGREIRARASSARAATRATVAGNAAGWVSSRKTAARTRTPNRAPIHRAILRQPLGRASGSAGRGMRSAPRQRVAQMLGDALVAAEQLVAAVAAEHDLDVALGGAREIPRRKRRWVGERFVERGHDARRSRHGSWWARRCVRWAAAAPPRSPRLPHFRRARNRETPPRTNAIRRAPSRPAGKRSCRSRCRPTGTAPAAGRRPAAARSPRRAARRRLRRRGSRRPVAMLGQPPGVELVFQSMRVGQPRDVGEDRARRRHISDARDRRRCASGERPRSPRGKPRQHAAHRRPEGECAIAMRIHDRLQAEPIADDMHAPCTEIDDGEREHAAQARQQAFDAPRLVAAQDELGVRPRAEPDAAVGQLRARRRAIRRPRRCSRSRARHRRSPSAGRRPAADR